MNINELRSHFKTRLSHLFSDSELKSIVKQIVIKRLEYSQSEFLLSRDVKFSDNDETYFLNVAERLAANEPFQYVIGEVFFAGIELKIDDRALIPRPETEELVHWVCETSKSDARILDLCSGSGCIALGLKSGLPSAEVTGVDASRDAVTLALENVDLTGLGVDFKFGDVLNNSFFTGLDKESYDVWVSNPPYIPYSDKVEMNENVLGHEPHMALFVDNEDPLIFYRVIADKAREYLKPGGALYFEIHEKLSGDINELLESLDFVNIELRKDLQGKYRMIRAIK